MSAQDAVIKIFFNNKSSYVPIGGDVTDNSTDVHKTV